MERAEREQDEDRRESPDDPQRGAELISDVSESQQAAFTDSEGDETRRDDEEAVDDDDDDDDDDDEDEDDELIVLDPEHPLMKRFQSALKKHLTEQLERLELKLQEKVMEEQMEKSRYEQLCTILYSEQRDLATLQASLEILQENRAKAASDRRQAEEQLEITRNEYRSITEQVKKEHTKVSELQSEVDTFARRLIYMQEVTSDLHSEVAAMKNTKNKAQAEKRQAEEQKLQQDLYVERLIKQVEKLREQIALYEVQTLAQTKDKEAARDALAEAQLELDSIVVEKKQILQQLDSSMIEMKRRDEAYTTMQEALRSANHELRALDTELEGFNRSITQEQEKNEVLTVMVNRAELNRDTYRKLLTQIGTKKEALQKLCTTYTRTLQETEKSLTSVTTECSVRQSELTILTKQIEKEACVRMELEEKIMRKMQEQLTHDSSAKHTHHLTMTIMAQHREKEGQLAKVKGDSAAVTLEVSEVALRLEALSRLQLEQEQEVKERNQLLLTKEAAVTKLISTIERNQATISMYNKKIEQIRASTGHEDLGPLEIEVRALNKQLEELGAEKKEQHQSWLWQQGELVRLRQEKQAQSSATQTLNTQLTILQQRNIRNKSEIEQEERGLVELERESKVLRLDMEKLNSLLNQKAQLKQELEQSNSLMEKSFIQTLKDAERESVEMQLRLEKLQEEKKQLLNSLEEAERQIMLWERKIQLAKETRLAVESEVGKGDMPTIKAEIHRKERHYNQLLKQREMMLREMEAAVARRENIVRRSEAQTQSNRKHTTRANLQNTLQNLQRNILQTHKQAEEYSGVIAQLQQEQSSLCESLKEKQMQITDLKNTSSTYKDDIKDMQETKEKNLIQLLALQSRVKQLQLVMEDRYRATAKGEDVLQLAMNTLQEELNMTRDVLQQVLQDYPQYKPLLHRICLLLSAHTHSE
ncbi:coiled-coil domain-containing protein 40 [Tachysurus vachellii]|uniref:coiled-coil domain-containing protein 40 n=1 Tax=Tachysurus vachellii TaxID=175792 RepID=UPI00296B0BF8|nr:coiled-coil domain-containing protein 40 [Tachysurus vachellii]